MPRQVLLVCADAETPPEAIAAVQGAVASALRLEARIGPSFEPPAESLDVARGQYLADEVLRALPLPGEADLGLGLLGVDLFTNGMSFVFGMAYDRAAVVSTLRLASDEPGPRGQALFLVRVMTEAVHEVGHLLGLGHCRDRGCVMFFSNTIADTDRKGPNLCPRCRSALETGG